MLLPHNLPPLYERVLAVVERRPRAARRIARRLRRDCGDDTAAAWATYTLGWVLLRTERLAEAAEHLHAAYQRFQTLNDEWATLHCWRATLVCAWLRGAGAALQDEWEAVAAAYTARDAAVEVARTRTYQMAHLNMLGRSADALHMADQVEQVLRSHGTPDDLARVLRVIAIAHTNQSDFVRARMYLDESLHLFERLRCAIDVAKCSMERSYIAQRRELYAECIADLESALHHFKRLDLPLYIAICHRSLGAVYIRLGHYKAALHYTVQARSEFDALGQTSSVAECDENIGAIAFYIGLYDLAFASYWCAEKVFTLTQNDQAVHALYRNRALMLLKQGQPAAALVLLQQIEPQVQAAGDVSEQAYVVLALAQAWAALGADEQALVQFERARSRFAQVGNHVQAARCRMEQGWILLGRTQVAAAQDCFVEAAPNVADRPMHLWRVLHGLGRCAELLGATVQAREQYEQAGAIVARLRRTLASEHASSAIFNQAAQVYTDAMRLAVQAGTAAQVLQLAEQQRELVLSQFVTHQRWLVPPDLRTEYEQQRAALSHLAVASEQFEATLNAYLHTLLHIRQPTITMPDDQHFSLGRIQTALQQAFPQGWNALIYVPVDATHLALLHLRESALTLYHIELDDQLQTLLQRVCNPDQRALIWGDLARLINPQRPAWQELQQLADALIPAPIREHLAVDRRLLIVPCGGLHHLAWGALRLDEHWLCEQAIVQLVPSLTLWQRLAQRQRSGDELLLIGCRSFGDRAEPLPHVGRELDVVEAHWPRSATRLQDAAATHDTVLDMAAADALSRYAVLHIASHAHLVAHHGLGAHIKLWDADLRYNELGALGLGGALVVLSTCYGAFGDVLPGEEIISLRRALLASGANDVIANLWTTSDERIVPLIERIYIHLAAGDDPPTALAQAQRALLQQARSTNTEREQVILWGGFQALGAGAKL